LARSIPRSPLERGRDVAPVTGTLQRALRGDAGHRSSPVPAHTTPGRRSLLDFSAVPDSVPTGRAFLIGARHFIAHRTRPGQRIWLGDDPLVANGVLLKTGDGTYAVAPWLEDAALRVALIEGLLDTLQLILDDALPSLRAWRALRDGVRQG